jgi:predicted MFS family arabinose efflux permease
MVALAAGMGVGRFLYTPILPVMAEQLGLTASQAGLIASANYLGYLAGALLAAMGGLGKSQHKLLLGGLILNVAGLMAMGLTSSFIAHLMIRFTGGLASAFILVFASALVMEGLSSSQRGGLSAVHFGGVGIGIFVSAVVTTAFAGADWRTLWFAGAVLAAIGLSLAVLLISPGRQVTEALKITTGNRNGPAMRVLIVSYGLFGFGYIITATFIVAIIRDTPDIRSMEHYVWAIVGLAGVPSVALWLWVSRKTGILQAYAFACIVEAIGVASSVLSGTAIGIVIAAAFLGGTFIAITALGLMTARSYSSGDGRVNVALMTASFGAGQVVGPVFAGGLADLTGSYLIPSLTATAALVIAAGLALLTSAMQKRLPA